MSTRTIPAGGSAPAARRPGWIAPALRSLVLSGFEALTHGEITLSDGEVTRSFGRADGGFPLRASVRVQDPSFWRQVALGGSVGAGEAYVQGKWTCDDLTALIRILARNREALMGMESGAARIGALLGRAWHALRRNTREGSRRNIAAHYDLGNDFYSLFLDREMMYSCAWFQDETTDLDTASVAKIDRILARLDLRPGHHLLEIGTGWGSLALHAARKTGCRVTTTTISREQHAHTVQRVKDEGLEDRVRVLLEDYRDLKGSYDRLVSVEMIEAVGEAYIGEYLQRCSSLLKADGRMVLQAIVIDDRLYGAYRKSPDFIQLLVFPGCHLPSPALLARELASRTDLRVVRSEDLAPHYARTLREWRRRFLSRREEVLAMGFPESFIRLWEYYLSYCEGGFTERTIGDLQMVLDKPLHRECRAAA